MKSPVKERIDTFGLVHRRLPTSLTLSLLQGTMLTTPGGTPASWIMAARARVDRGVSSPGFTTQVQPTMIASVMKE